MAPKKKEKPFAERSEAERQKHFIDASGLVGKTIVDVRYMTDKEADEMGWGGKSVVLTLNDNTDVVVSMDDEGNGAGALFVTTPKGVQVTLPVFPSGGDDGDDGIL